MLMFYGTALADNTGADIGGNANTVSGVGNGAGGPGNVKVQETVLVRALGMVIMDQLCHQPRNHQLWCFWAEALFWGHTG